MEVILFIPRRLKIDAPDQLQLPARTRPTHSRCLSCGATQIPPTHQRIKWTARLRSDSLRQQRAL